ncbi:MAG: SIMPL domain-containing protein [Alphaproteobacteria bacterium]
MTTPARFLLALLLTCAAVPAVAEEGYKPDDQVAFDLSTEGWATTTTARVTVVVDAAGAGSSTATMRDDMQKAVNTLAKADWRLVNFSRSQDQTGLERWNANFEARVPENQLGGIHDAAKKLGKAGMQITVADIAFDPTLAEIEEVRAALRADLYKQIGTQLTALNTAFPGRQYRVSTINFSSPGMPQMMARPMMMKATMAMAGASEAMDASAPMERAQKISQQAQVVFAALPPVAAK